MTLITHHDEMMDVTLPDLLEVIITEDGTRIWINVDGRCVLRAYRIKALQVDWRGKIEVVQDNASSQGDTK